MPYFVYRVTTFPVLRLEKVAAHAAFGPASAMAKAMRVDPALPTGCAVKVVFAEDELGAEDLLSQARAPKRGLDGDE